MGTDVTLARTPPQIYITNPVTNMVAQPYIQLQGYSPLPLAGVTYDLSNAVMFVDRSTGQPPWAGPGHQYAGVHDKLFPMLRHSADERPERDCGALQRRGGQRNDNQPEHYTGLQHGDQSGDPADLADEQHGNLRQQFHPAGLDGGRQRDRWGRRWWTPAATRTC